MPAKNKARAGYRCRVSTEIPSLYGDCVDVQVRDVDVPDLLQFCAFPQIGAASILGFITASGRHGESLVKPADLPSNAEIRDPEVNSRVAAYELAFRMQAAAP